MSYGKQVVRAARRHDQLQAEEGPSSLGAESVLTADKVTGRRPWKGSDGSAGFQEVNIGDKWGVTR